MSLRVEVMSMAQEMNLEDKSVSHFVLLKVGEKVIRALITEESAQIIINATFANASPADLLKEYVDTGPSVITSSKPPAEEKPQPVGRPFNPNPMSVAETDDGVAAVFGGNVEVPKPPPSLPKQKIVRVEKDEWGYPRITTAGGEDPGEVVGGQDQDEDGVGQI